MNTEITEIKRCISLSAIKSSSFLSLRESFFKSSIHENVFLLSPSGILPATSIRQSTSPTIPQKNPWRFGSIDRSEWNIDTSSSCRVKNYEYPLVSKWASESKWEKEKVTGRKTRSCLQTLWSWVWECFPAVTCSCACGPAYEECVHVFIRMFALFPLGSGGSYGNQEDFCTWEQRLC